MKARLCARRQSFPRGWCHGNSKLRTALSAQQWPVGFVRVGIKIHGRPERWDVRLDALFRTDIDLCSSKCPSIGSRGVSRSEICNCWICALPPRMGFRPSARRAIHLTCRKLRERFKELGSVQDRVVTYCAHGATVPAFAAILLEKGGAERPHRFPVPTMRGWRLSIPSKIPQPSQGLRTTRRGVKPRRIIGL